VTLPKRLVLDANILLRGVLGNRVRALLEAYESEVSFYSPDVCFEDARTYIPSVAKRRRLDITAALAVLDQLEKIVEAVDRSLYEVHESVARNRMASRDIEDWPIMAAAMLLDCPIWTEDQDFFGSGVATWTTANVELYLQNT
jgi:predicted nucleic acid-binding protein